MPYKNLDERRLYQKEYQRKWRKKNIEKAREQGRKEGQTPLRKKQKSEWNKTHPERCKQYYRKWNKSHPEYLEVRRKRDAERRLTPSRIKWKREYNKKRKAIDPGYKLSMLLRSRLCKAIKRDQKSGSAVHDLGCSIADLRTYLESLWQPGMDWDNWSLKGWHIDHIVPLASFDLTNREQFLKACHYTNLQPLWALGKGGNLSKGKRQTSTNIIFPQGGS